MAALLVGPEEDSATLYGQYGVTAAGAWRSGVELAVLPGTELLASQDGTVAYVGQVDQASGYGEKDLGLGLVLDHGDGYCSVYANCQDVLVQVGDSVTLGDAVATSAAAPESRGDGSGPYFYYGLRYEGEAVDPLTLVL